MTKLRKIKLIWQKTLWNFIFYQENIQILSKSDDFDIENKAALFSAYEILYAFSSIETAKTVSAQVVKTFYATETSGF